MKITVCVPAYNEANIIERTLRTIKDFCQTQPQHDWKIVVANNKSTDDTTRCAKRVSDVSVIEVGVRGKGAAVREAARQDTSDIFCFIDADLSAKPTALTELLSALLKGTDVAIGSRLLDTSKQQRSFLRTLSSRLFNIFRQVILGIKVSDSQCGLKAMNKKGKEILISGSESGWFFDMELLTKAERAGLVVTEIAVPWQETVYPERESKLRIFRDGWQGLLAMVRIRRNVSSEKELFKLASFILIGVAAIIYSGMFFWHTSAVSSSGQAVEFLYYERGDSTGYVDMARSILNGDESLLANDETARGLRTPGYPIFLAAVFTISDNPYLVIILQILIALATLPLLYGIGQKITNGTVAFLATLAYIIYPTTAFLNTQILSETLFMFFTSLALWLLLNLPKQKALEFLVIGAAVGTATLVRPSFLYIIPFILAYILVSKDNIWQKIIRAGIVAIGIFIILAPWIHANQRDFNHPALSTAGNFNILYIYIPQFLAQNVEAEHGWLTITERLMNETKAAGYQIGSHRASSFESEQIQTELAGKKLAYLTFHLKRSILTLVTSGLKMFNNELTELGRPIFSATPWLIQHVYTYGISFALIKNNFLAFSDTGLMLLVNILLPISVIVVMWRRDKQIWGILLIFCMIIITVLLAGPNGNARYRMPIQPYIFLLAFLSLQIIFNSTKNYLQRLAKKQNV